jgi:cysteine desulfurase
VAHTRTDAGTTGLLDASRGPIHPAAQAAFVAAMDLAWADPTALHPPGRRARAALDGARSVLSGALGVRPDELSVHPDAETALEVGLLGLCHARRRVGARLVAGATERSILLLQPGVEDPVPVDHTGRVDLDVYATALHGGGVAAAVVQTANAEVGTRQPVTAVDALCREAGVPLLLDATASVGRDPLPPPAPAAVGSVLVADASAFGGPPLGLLAVRTGTRWGLPGPRREAEQGRAAAAPWVPLVLAAAQAWQLVDAEHEAEARTARTLVDRVRRAAASVADVEVVGEPDDRLPHVVTFSALYVDGEVLLDELARRDLVVGSGSACTSSVLRPSHVLAAMGVLTHGNIRITLPLGAVSPTREQDVDRLCRELPDAVATVRRRLGTDDL